MYFNKVHTQTSHDDVPSDNYVDFSKNDTSFSTPTTQKSNDEEQIQMEVLKESRSKLDKLQNQVQHLEYRINNNYSLKVKYESYMKYLSDTNIPVMWKEVDDSVSPMINISPRNQNGIYKVSLRNRDNKKMECEWPISKNEILKNLFLSNDNDAVHNISLVLDALKEDKVFCNHMDIHKPAPTEDFKDLINKYDECSKKYEDIRSSLKSVGITEEEISRIENAARARAPYLPSCQDNIDRKKTDMNDEIKSQVTDPYNERTKSYKKSYIASGILSVVGIGVLGFAITGLIHLIDKVCATIKIKKKEKNFKTQEKTLVKEFNESVDENKSDMDIKSYKELTKYNFLQTRKKYPKDEVDAISYELREKGFTN